MDVVLVRRIWNIFSRMSCWYGKIGTFFVKCCVGTENFGQLARKHRIFLPFFVEKNFLKPHNFSVLR
ncbi:MAG: hypothetical protein BAA00_16315 [Parageobacillus thermoglucosidasius]|nr:MAG: hypothetical protein BAA00_16315 [Parageobacillus thermoglucosidasius]